MEFLVTLLLLYLVQCAAFLPRESMLFSRPVRRWRVRVGPGWRLLPWLPAAAWLYTHRFPFRLREDRLCARSGPSRFGWSSSGSSSELAWPAPGRALEASGRLVRLGGRPFYRAPGKRAATRMADWLRSLEGTSLAEIRSGIASELATSLSLPLFREQRDRFSAATRVLGWLCDSYACFLFVGVPILILVAHEERGLLIAFIGIGALHVATLVALDRAQRKLFPSGRGERFEELLSAALYPPLLLRAYGELRIDFLGGFHPAVAAAELLPEADRVAFLRAEVLRLERSAAESRDEVADLERTALLALLTEYGETREGLMKPPQKKDAQARSYCPICSTDYVRLDGTCADCGTELTPYPG